VQAVVEAPGGGFFVLGSTWSTEARDDVLVLRLDASGSIVWQRQYGGIGDGRSERGDAITATSDGGAAFAATIDRGRPLLSDMWVVRVDGDGNILWQMARDEIDLSNWPASVHETLDGGLLVASTREDYVICASRFDAAGTLLWDRCYHAEAGEAYDWTRGAWPIADGGLIVAGTSRRFPDGGASLLRLDSTGGVAWHRWYAGYESQLGSVRRLQDGRFAAVGLTSLFLLHSLHDILVVVTDSEGRVGEGCESQLQGDLQTIAADSLVGWSETNGTVQDSAATVTDTTAVALPATDTGQEVCLCDVDRWESDEACESWVPMIRPGETQPRNFCGGADDWVRFPACGGRSYRLETTGLGPAADTVLEVWDPDCGSLLAEAAGGGPGQGARLDWTAPAGGTYSLRVRQADGDTGGDRDYDLTVAGSTCAARTWVRSYGSGWGERVGDVIQASDGGFVVVGDAFDRNSWDSNVWVGKLDQGGNLEWEGVYGEGNGRDEHARAVAETDGGRFLVAGSGEEASSIRSDLLVLTVEPDGWLRSARSRGDEGVSESAEGLARAADGAWLAAGHRPGGAWVTEIDAGPLPDRHPTYGGYSIHAITDGDQGFHGAVCTAEVDTREWDARVLSIDFPATVRWDKTYGGPGFEEAMDIRAVSGGGFVLAGYSSSWGAGTEDGWVLMLDGDGNVEWEKAYGSDQEWERFTSVVEVQGGGFVVVGYTSTRTTPDDLDAAWALKLDSQGNILWQKAYGGAGTEEFQAVASASDGGLLMAGWTSSFGFGGGFGNDGEFWLVKTDADGNVEGDCPFVRDTDVIARDTVAVVADFSTEILSLGVTDTDDPSPRLTPGMVQVREQCGGAPSVELVPPPGEVSPRLAVVPLHFVDRQTLAWDEPVYSGSETFNLYRGLVSGLPGPDFGACLQADLAVSSATDPGVPPSGAIWTYLVSGENAAGEGPLGYGSDGRGRENLSPCP